MSWITLQYFAPLTKGVGFAAPVEKVLKDWGITTCTREAQNQAQDNLGFDITTNAIGSELFQYGGKVAVWIGRQGTVPAGLNSPTSFSGGTRFYVGYRVKNVRSATGKMQAFKYKFSNAWGFLFERHVFQKLWPTWNGLSGAQAALILQPRSQVILGQSVTTITQANGVQTDQQTLAEALIEALTFTMNQTVVQFGSAQFQVDAALPTSNFDGVGGWEGYCPLDAANDNTCAEAVRRIVKIVPAVSMWFDYSTEPPTFHAATRDTLPSVTLPFGNALETSPYGNYTSTIDRRDDIVPPCVDYKYRITTTVDGQQYVQVVDDLACAAGSTDANGVTAAALLPFSEYFGAEVATFDFEGQSSVITSLNTKPIPFNVQADLDNNPASTGAPSIWKTVLATALSDPSVAGVTAAIGTPTATLTNKAGGTKADPRYLYFMIGGPIPKGISDPANPNLQQGVQLTLSAQFSFTEQTLLSDGKTYGPVSTKTETKTVDMVCFSLANGTFQSITQEAEPIPVGLAAFVYNIEKIPQYDLTHGIVESDPDTGFPTITNPCQIGVNLNLSGGLPEYATMNAQVQQVSYDLMTGHSDITCGVASHLGGTEMIERLRINRGPRWYYEIGGGSTNNQAAVSGPTQVKDTQKAATVRATDWMPTSLSGVPPEPPPAGSGLNSGVYRDSGNLPTAFTGSTGGLSRPFGQGAAIVIADGPDDNTPGESNAWIRQSLADFNNDDDELKVLQGYFREVETNESSTVKYRLFHCTNGYLDSLGVDTPIQLGGSGVAGYQLTIVSEGSNTINCTYDGGPLNGQSVVVAKPYFLRGFTATTTDSQGNIQEILQPYGVGNTIYAIAPTGGTGISNVTLQDVNADARAIATYLQTCETISGTPILKHRYFVCSLYS